MKLKINIRELKVVVTELTNKSKTIFCDLDVGNTAPAHFYIITDPIGTNMFDKLTKIYLEI